MATKFNYSEATQLAIAQLKERAGSSVVAILKQLLLSHPELNQTHPDLLKRTVVRNLKSGTEKGVYVRVKNSFKLGEAVKEGVKKAVKKVLKLVDEEDKPKVSKVKSSKTKGEVKQTTPKKKTVVKVLKTKSAEKPVKASAEKPKKRSKTDKPASAVKPTIAKKKAAAKVKKTVKSPVKAK